MDNFISPEILGYAQQIVNKTIGAKTKVNSFGWSEGGLFNKVFKVDTTDGDFVLKIECDTIFFSTRKEQIENEVLGNELFKKAGIPTASILAYDYTKADIGVRYVFSEYISEDLLFIAINNLDSEKRLQIQRQVTEIFNKMKGITSGCFGSISPNGILGQHKTWGGYNRYLFNLLIKDGEECGTFTEEEIAILKETADKAFNFKDSISPSFVHGDLGSHNALLRKVNGQDVVYIIDFGNAYYGLPRFDEYMIRKHGDFGFAGYDITDDMGDTKDLYNQNLCVDFERMFWRETERLTQDYAYCRDWMIPSIEAAKADTSREHIIEFINKCRKILL